VLAPVAISLRVSLGLRGFVAKKMSLCCMPKHFHPNDAFFPLLSYKITVQLCIFVRKNTMIGFEEKYINPFTDYGFKKLFGEEPNKDLLLDFLNELLKEEQGQIKELTYLKSEHLGTSEIDRKAIFDLYCENEKGEKFIVELQKSKHPPAGHSR
jgi:hypothetical protein